MNSLYVDRETGRKAQELYDNLVPYFNQIEDNLNAQFKACPVRDQDGLTLIHIHFKMLEALKQNIQSVISTGKMATIELEKEES